MSLDDFDRGRRIGKYEILTRLSVGGMAEIFLAYTAGPGGFRKFVTLKRILPYVRDDEQFLSMFLEEARLTAAMSHPGIAQVFELGEDDGEFYLAMEFIPGQDVRQMLKASSTLKLPIPVGIATRIIRDTCNALHYAHHFKDGSGEPTPIVHRDVSPKNVMVTYEGDVKVIDFGIAKARGSLGRTKAGTIKGTTPYMSPEQLLGEPLDGRSDLFAAGAMLHELLTGKRLFAADDESVVTRMIVHDPISSPGVMKPLLPPALVEVVMRSLDRDLKLRFQTGREMARAIEQAMGGGLSDEDSTGVFMRQLFSEKLARTRALLALSIPPDEGARLRRVAGALRDDLQESGSRVRRLIPSPVPANAEHDDITTSALPLEMPQVKRPASSRVPTVMVVDDSAVGISFVKMALAALGCKVVGCPDPLEAVALFDAEQPDLVILDVVMPDIDGFEVCRRIRERSPHRYLPILFLSSACSLEERVKGLTVGGDDFIRKPCDREELLARVRINLQRAASLREAAAKG